MCHGLAFHRHVEVWYEYQSGKLLAPNRATNKESHSEKFSGHTEAVLARSCRQEGQVHAQHLSTAQEDCRLRQALGDSQEAEPFHATPASPDGTAVPWAWTPQVLMAQMQTHFWPSHVFLKGIEFKNSEGLPQSDAGRPSVSCSSLWQMPVQLEAGGRAPVGCPSSSQPCCCQLQAQLLLYGWTGSSFPT